MNMNNDKKELKQITRRALMDAALNQLSADNSFSMLSLREVSREAGIAPTSFYRHFRELEELGLALVSEASQTLLQLMTEARKQIANGASIVSISIDTFMAYLEENPKLFRLLLREREGLSDNLRNAIQKTLEQFVAEIEKDLIRVGIEQKQPLARPHDLAEAMVTIVFNHGSSALDLPIAEWPSVSDKIKFILRVLLIGAETYQKK
jgi:AcrR family transcriptional regulator